MSAVSAKASLIDAMKELRRAWDRAKGAWDDQAARRFEEDVLRELEPRVAAALKGIDQVIELSASARRECGDDGGAA